MPASSMVQVRVDEKTQARATKALMSMGVPVSDAVCVSVRRVAAEQQLPFEIRVPNAPTRAAMDEAWTMSRARFKRAGERLRDFEEDSGR